MHIILPSFFTLALVILVSRFVGNVFRKFGQPAVMGEVLGGIILGPSCIGLFFPQFTEIVFPPPSVSLLKHIAEIGILFYLFIIGLEIDLPRLSKSAKSAVVISQASIGLPFVLGLVFAGFIYEMYAPLGVGLMEFSLFIGVSLSVTAFPVLARILADSKLHRTSLAELALTCAAANDITAWCLVAVISGLMNSALGGSLVTLGLTVVYLVVMLYFIRPIVVRWSEKNVKTGSVPESLFSVIVVGTLVSAAITEAIGIHGLFGAFLFGAIIPSESTIARDLTARLQEFIRILFLPAFFALTGIQTQIGLLVDLQDWLVCGVIIGLAVLGKFGGTYIAARISGKNEKESTILGILMNTRGMVEIIVLNIGLSVGVLTPALYTIFVVMAIVTTLMTGPLLSLVLNKK